MNYKEKAMLNLTSKKLWGFIILLALITTVLLLDTLTSEQFTNIVVITVPAYFVSNAYQDRQKGVNNNENS